MKNTSKIIGEKIKALREKAGISQQELAEKAHSSPTSINRIENGHQAPRFDTIVEIAQALKVSLGDIWGELEQAKEVAKTSSDVERARLLIELFSLLPTLSDDQLGAILSLCRTAERKNAGALAGNRDTA